MTECRLDFLSLFFHGENVFDLFRSLCPNRSISICSDIYFRLFFVKRRLLHSRDVVTSVNAVQYGKDADMENQGVTLWKRFLNRRKSINTVSQNNCTLAISIEMSEGQYERSSTCLYQKSQHIFPDSSQQKVLREKHKKQGKYRVTLPASDTRQFWDSLC